MTTSDYMSQPVMGRQSIARSPCRVTRPAHREKSGTRVSVTGMMGCGVIFGRDRKAKPKPKAGWLLVACPLKRRRRIHSTLSRPPVFYMALKLT